jgi:hypothetical protein
MNASGDASAGRPTTAPDASPPFRFYDNRQKYLFAQAQDRTRAKTLSGAHRSG